MSRRRFSDKQRLRQRLKTEIAANEPKPLRFRMRLGDGTSTNNVIVADDPNYCYAYRDNRGIIEKVLNMSVVPRDNLPVIVGYKHEQPDLLQVLEVNWREVVGPSTFAYLPHHHYSHELFNARGGDDVVWVQKQQILPLLAYATTPASMQVEVFSGWYPFDDGFTYFPETTSDDLTPYLPTGTNQALVLLITIDGATNDLQYTMGGQFSSVLPVGDIDDLIPQPPAGSVPIVGVYMTNTTASLSMQSNLYDLRAMFGGVDGSVLPATHDILSSYHDAETHDPDQGDIIIGITGSTWSHLAVGVTGSFLRSDGNLPFWWSGSFLGEHNLLSVEHLDTETYSPPALGNFIVGTGSIWVHFGVGPTGTVLASDGIFPFWATGAFGSGGGVGIHTLLGASHSDTETYSPPVFGDLIFSTGTNWKHLPVGSEEDYLRVIDGLPTWTTGSAGGGGANHNLLSVTHLDAEIYSPPGLGDMIVATGSQWVHMGIGNPLDTLRVNATGIFPEWQSGIWEPLTDGDTVNPELVFVDGDVIMVFEP